MRGQTPNWRGQYSNRGEILRTNAESVPALSVSIGVTLWMLLTFIMAVRQALDYRGFARAFAVCALGWLVHAFVLFGPVLTAF